MVGGTGDADVVAGGLEAMAEALLGGAAVLVVTGAGGAGELAVLVVTGAGSAAGLEAFGSAGVALCCKLAAGETVCG